MVRHPRHSPGYKGGPLLRVRVLNVGQDGTAVLHHTSSMVRLKATYNSQYNVQTLLCPTCVTSHDKRVGDDKPVAGYGSASNPILSYSGRAPGWRASVHRVRCDFTKIVTAHVTTTTMLLPWVLPIMIAAGIGVIVCHGGYRNAEYYPHFAFGLRSVAESMVTAMTLGISIMPMAPKRARIIGSKVGRLSLLTAVVAVASAAHKLPAYIPTQFARAPLQASASPHTFTAPTMPHLKLPSMTPLPAPTT
jgi:hypothetical protein